MEMSTWRPTGLLLVNTVSEVGGMLIGRSCFAVGTGQEEVVEGETKGDGTT